MTSSERQEQFVAKAAMIANAVLAVGGIGSLLVLAYFLYHYGWTGERQFTSLTGVALHYVLPAMAAALLLSALRLKRGHRINLTIGCLALAVSVYAAELALRLVAPVLVRSSQPMMVALQASKNKQQMAEQLASEFHVPIDPRDKLEFLTELRSKGVDAVPSVIPRYQLRYRKEDGNQAAPSASPRILPLGGISNKVTVLCNENGQYVTYESDEHGFRNPKGLWDSGRIEIVALGDSFTQGYCVPDDKYFVDIVRQHYPATLNLGMAGKGGLLMLAALREYAAPLKPKLVLWTYFEGNDLLDLQDERQSEVLLRYLDDGFTQNLLDRQAEADRALLSFVATEATRAIAQRRERERNTAGVVGESLQFMKLPALRSRLGLLNGTRAEETAGASVLKGSELELFQEILSRARATVHSWGGELHFVYLPNWTRYDKRVQGAIGERAAESQRDNVLKIVKDLGIPLIDVLPSFDAHNDPMSLFPFGAPGHYTEEGHGLVADEVLKAIETTGLARVERAGQRGRGPRIVAPEMAARIR